MGVMMKCGCVSMSVCSSRGGKTFDPPIPSCLTHDCLEISDTPNLEGRTAVCAYFGKRKPKRRYANDECNHSCRGKDFCECGSVKSSLDLAFFKHRPDMGQDYFFCGCFGWD